MSASGQKVGRIKLGNLYGAEGNSFIIMGRAQLALVGLGWSAQRVAEWIKSASSGDYADLLELVLQTFHVTRQEKLTAAKLIDQHRKTHTPGAVPIGRIDTW